MPSFKQRLYSEFARVGRALGSDRRLELLDLLAQGPRNVEALASETGMSVANVSQHLQIMRRAKLVESTREGTKILYQLAGHEVLALWLALETTATARLAEVEQIEHEYVATGAEPPLPREELQRGLKRGDVYLIDVRPPLEFESGHLAGAASIPIEELSKRLKELPRDRPIIAYCRGRYCLMADEAVALLRKRGFDAHRLEGGWPEWVSEGRPVNVAPR
jgi:rhodanese-related sulfurtransferase/DNA-binding MarR family transcriptional regulator